MWKSTAVLAASVTLFCGSAAANPAAAEPNCQLKRFATLPITITTLGQITVPIKVNGQFLNLLVDTGSYATALSDAAAVRLHLDKQSVKQRDRLIGMGNLGSVQGAAADMEIARVPITGKAFNLIPIPDNDVDGLLGADILRIFDVDIDYAGGQLNLYSSDHCPGQVVYWTHGPHATVPVDVSDKTREISLDVEVDGHSYAAYLDTGASASAMIYEEALGHFDIDKSVLSKDRRYPFKTLSFEGGVAVSNPDIRLYQRHESFPLDPVNHPHMLVGADILRQLHIYIAYKEEKLYITGLPVEATAYAHLVQGLHAAAINDAPQAIAQYSAALNTAGLLDDQRRRALLGRAKVYYWQADDCKLALVDLEAAMAMRPDSEEAHADRARVKMCLGDKSAIDDTNFVLGRRASAINYSLRALAYWTFGDYTAAAADFGNANELAPGDVYGFLWRAFSAMRVGKFDLQTFRDLKSRERWYWTSNWPLQLVDVYLDAATLADLAKAVAEEDYKHPRQCEADFYIGQLRLAHGQTAEAKQLLQRASQECAPDSLEARMAKLDVSRLPDPENHGAAGTFSAP